MITAFILLSLLFIVLIVRSIRIGMKEIYFNPDDSYVQRDGDRND